MKNLLNKEMKLSASPLSYLFIAFSLMTMIPGYPILVGAFFVCFGIFQSFQSGRENNDILYTILLPIKKTDAVKAKFAFTVFIQMVSFVCFALLTFLRMAFLPNAAPYVSNPMMNANQAFLAYILLTFALFNCVFLCGFFKTAYKFGKPFIFFLIVSFVFVGAAEAVHHFPGLEFLNDTAAFGNAAMWIMLVAAVIVYAAATAASCSISMKRFEKVDM